MIKEACVKRGVKHVNSNKLYFGRFNNKVTVALPLHVMNKFKYFDVINANNFKEYLNSVYKFKQAREKFINELFDICPIDSFEYRSSSSSVTLYTDDDDGLAEFINSYNGYISEVGTPKSDTIAEYMKDNPNLLFRKSYFHGKYKYCVVINWRNQYNETVNQFLINGYGAELENREYHACAIIDTLEVYRNSRSRIYFNSIDDVLLARIALSDAIDRIEEIILFEDVENARSIAA